MMEYNLKKVNSSLEGAISAESSGDYSKARDLYLKTSKLLFEAAKESHGRVKEARVENAEKLLKRAESIKAQTSRNKQHGGKKARKQKEGEAIDSQKGFQVQRRGLNVTFSDVAGLEDVKEEVKNKIIYPFTHPEDAREYGISSGGGILLYGPPGTGKTFLAKAVASEIEATFFKVEPSDLMGKYVGETEENIKNLFDSARGEDRAVLFFDEVEGLFQKRSGSPSTIVKRSVPQLLAEIDGVDTTTDSILVLGATNVPWNLTDAALRPGRFDEKIYVPPPDLEARKSIFELYLGDTLIEDLDYGELGEVSEGYSGADIKYICEKAKLIPFKEKIQTGEKRGVSMSDVYSAMEKIKPSINKKSLKRYSSFASGQG